MALTGLPIPRINPAKMPMGIHYTWVIVAVLAVVQVFGSSIFMVVGIMVPPLSDETGDFRWDTGTITAALAVYYLFGAIFSPFCGYLGDRFGVCKTLLVGAGLYTTSMISLGFVTEIWHFFLFYSFLMSMTAAITMVPMMASISGWFRLRLGLGIGILWAAGGIGSAILAPMMAYLLNTVGWQTSFIVLGVLGGSAMLLVQPFLRNRPSDIGIKPYGAKDDDPPPVVRDKVVEGLRLRAFNQNMRRTKAFWNLPLVHGLGCAGHGIVMVFVVKLAIERGLGFPEATVTITIISLVSIASRLFTPIMAELYGPKKMMAASLTIQGLTVIMLFWAHDLWVFYVFGAVFGLGFGGEWTGYLVINRKYFGEGPMGSLYGFQMTGALLGHAVTMLLSGLVIYATGSLLPVFYLSVAFNMVGVVVIIMLESTSHVLIPDWEDDLPAEARTTSVAGPEMAPGMLPGFGAVAAAGDDG